MTGVYVEVKRNDERIDIEIEYLDHEELNKFLATKNEVWKTRLIDILCTTIVGAEQEISELEDTLDNLSPSEPERDESRD
jgi:hypothetical protein